MMSRVRAHARHEWPSRNGHLDVYELVDGRTIGYLTADDVLVGRLVDHPVEGVALTDLLRLINR
jgi:hypothetical protein